MHGTLSRGSPRTCCRRRRSSERATPTRMISCSVRRSPALLRASAWNPPPGFSTLGGFDIDLFMFSLLSFSLRRCLRCAQAGEGKTSNLGREELRIYGKIESRKLSRNNIARPRAAEQYIKTMVPAIFYTTAFVAVTTLPFWYYHTQLHGLNVLQSW